MRLAEPARRRSPVAMTSLVDVVFILLFFFMLAAGGAPPQMLRLEMPQTAKASVSGAMPVVEVLPAARVRWRAQELSMAAWVSALQANPVDRIRVELAQDARLQDLVTVLDEIRAAGAKPILAGERR